MRITIDIDDATGAVTITPGTNAPDTSAAEERRMAAIRSFVRYDGYPEGVLHVDVWDHDYGVGGSLGKRYTAKWPNHRAVLSVLFDWQDAGKIGRVWHYDDCAFWGEEWGVPGVCERPSCRGDMVRIDVAWAKEFGYDIS